MKKKRILAFAVTLSLLLSVVVMGYPTKMSQVAAATWTFQGKVYAGEFGDESHALVGVTISVYGANSPYPDPGTFICSTITDGEGWYGLPVYDDGGVWEYYHICETDLVGYTSVGAATVGGVIRTANWIEYAIPLEGKTLTENEFWDRHTMPDLVIAEIQCDWANSRTGYVVKNIGNAVAPAGHYTTLVYCPGPDLCCASYDWVDVALNPEESYQGWFSVLPAGTELYVCADTHDLSEYDNLIEESDEENNCQEWMCECPTLEKPDLVITDIWNEDSTICYQVRNVGDAVAPAGHYTALLVDEEYVVSDLVDADLQPGERRTGCFDYVWECTPLDDNIAVWADCDDVIAEKDETNNCREESWKCDTTPPQIISGPTVSEVTQNSATILWETDEDSDSVVKYGRTARMYALEEENSTLVREHSMTLIGLEPSATYGFVVRSTDTTGNSVQSQDKTFETLPLPDDIDPIVSIIDHGMCQGTVTISADASDDTGVQKVEFYLNGALVFTDYSPPYELPLDTTKYENGRYDLTSKVFDLAGKASTDLRQIDIANVKDKTSPTVTITSPKDGSTVSGTVTIKADINDDTGIDSVRFYVDGEYCQYESPWPVITKQILGQYFIWNSKTVSDGLHSVAVEAKDIDGKLGAQVIRLKVVNAPAPEPPIPYLTIVDNSVSRTQNQFTITLKVKNEGDAEASDVDIMYGLRGFQSIDASLAQVDFVSEYNAAGRYIVCHIKAKQNIPADGTQTYSFNVVPVLSYPNPPALGLGFFIDMSWRSPGGTNYRDYVEMPAAKTVGNETMTQAYDNALKSCDYLMVTDPELLYMYYFYSDVNSLLSAIAQLAWYEQGVPGYFYSYNAGALTNLTQVGGAWSNKLMSGWTSNGYLLIVGENKIMPAWTYKDGTINTVDDPNWPLQTNLTDLPYANTAGSILQPELSLGRIIGNDAAELKKVIDTSIKVYEGVTGYGFDRSNFFAVSGYPACLGGGCNNMNFQQEVLTNALTMQNRGIDGIVMFTLDYTQYDDKGKIDPILTKNRIKQEFFSNIPNKDVVFLAGHGNTGNWDEIDINDVLNPYLLLPFGYTSPFVFADSCLTGRYYACTSMAEAFLRRGAGAYLGAVESGLGSHSSISKKFYEKWDAGESVGLAVKQTKQSNSGQTEDYWSVIYNLYGDPKFGSQGPPGSPSKLSVATQGEPPSSVDVVIPDYQVTQSDGKDYVEIAGGGILSEQDEPLVPYYRVFYDYPQGCQVQDVSLASRSEPVAATGLNIPNFVEGHPGQDTSVQLQQSSGREWWPEKDFEWTVQEKPDGITLVITIYPFIYNPLTTDAKFCHNYSFDIAWTVSNVRITGLEISKLNYSLNKVTGYVEFSDGQEGEIPPTGTDITIDATFRRQGSGEVVGSVPICTLHDFRGRACYSFDYSNLGELPPVCDVEVDLTDKDGNLLDREMDFFEPSTPSLDVMGFAVSPQQCEPGDNVNIGLQLENTGIVDITDGTAFVIVKDQTGETIANFNHLFADLAPGAALSFTDSWSAPAIGQGIYDVLGYASYGDKSTEPQIIEVSVGAPLQSGKFWPYTFEDSLRGTRLGIDTFAQTFQFMTPEKEFPIKIAPKMKVINLSKGSWLKRGLLDKKWSIDPRGLGLDSDLEYDLSNCKFKDKPGILIIIQYQDKELRLAAVALDSADFCTAQAVDLGTGIHYFLFDRRGVQEAKPTVQPPKAGFNASPDHGRVPLLVHFTDKSTGEITHWKWDFGDGNTSIVVNPLHIYWLPGNYTVTLTVNGPGGDSSFASSIKVDLLLPGRR
jgi:PKD repeat protein